MTTPTITPPPTTPVRTMDKTTFNSAVAPFLAWFVTLVTDLTTFIGWADANATQIALDRADADAAAAAAAASQTAAATSETNALTSANASAASAASAVNAPGTSGTSTSTVAIGTGSQSFITQSGKNWVVGQRVQFADTANPSINWMAGAITAYSGTLLTVSIDKVGGSGSISSWSIGLSGATGAAGTMSMPVVSKTASYTHALGQNSSMYEFSGALGSAVALTIDPTIVGAGGWLGVHDTGTGPFRVVPASGTIDGRPGIVVYPGERFLIRSDGTNLRTVGRARRWLVESAAPSAASAVNMELAFTANNGAADPEMESLDYEYEVTTAAGTASQLVGRLKLGGSYATTSYQGSENGSSSSITSAIALGLPQGGGGAHRGRAFLSGPNDTSLTSLFSSGFLPSAPATYFCAGRNTGQAAAPQGVQFTNITSGTPGLTGALRCYINRSVL